ncbi:MAG: hypothetical protein AAFX85_09885, partial [Pseudomonadota bacterium]
MDLISFVGGAIAGAVAATAVIAITLVGRATSRAAAGPQALRAIKGLESGDPLADADLRMAHGHFEHAVEQLELAIAATPDRVDLKQKLLEVLFVWGNAEGFHRALAQHRGALEHLESWARVDMMSKQLP